MAHKSSLLTCQHNAYQKESWNTVISCVADKDAFRVVLDDSVLYPEGGGQPYDLGNINGIPVLKVIKPAAGAVEIELSAPLEVGATVKCEVDWARRYDFMQQHTAQHLFSAVATKLFNADTTGWALGADSVTVDLLSSPMLTPEQVSRIEDEVNALIRQGKPVSWQVCSKADLADDSNAALKELRGMVKGAALDMEELRLVSIEGVDLNPCGGTHLSSLAEINLLKVIALEKDRAALRVRFLAGQRALTYFQSCITREAALSAKLSAPPADHLNIADKLLKDRKDLSKRFEAYADELADFWGQSIVSALPLGPEVVVKHREGADLKFLLRAAGKAQEVRPDVMVLISGDDNNAIKAPTSGPFVIFGAPALVNKVKEPVMALLGGRGGGKPGRVQGFGSKIDQVAQAEAVLRASMV